MLSRLFKRPGDRQAEQQKVQESLTKTRRGLFSQASSLFQANKRFTRSFLAVSNQVFPRGPARARKHPAAGSSVLPGR